MERSKSDFPKVNILLSAYNGEKYLSAQMESLFSQTWPNLEIFIRDDGSTDATANIMKSYENESNVHLMFGKNLGFIQSFLTLLRDCSPADYYAFCDQDDVWLPEKIERAMAALEKESREEPLLYFTNYEYVDADLSPIGPGKVPTNISFRNSMVDCAPLGFNSVVNHTARELICKNIPQNACGHDWWSYMVCSGMGKVIYDNYMSVNYRRTGNNVSSGGASFLKFQIWRFKKFFLGNYFSNVTKMLQEYQRLYASQLTEEDRAVLALFTKKNIFTALKKITYPQKFRQNTVDEIFIRLCFLLGRL